MHRMGHHNKPQQFVYSNNNLCFQGGGGEEKVPWNFPNTPTLTEINKRKNSFKYLIFLKIL